MIKGQQKKKGNRVELQFAKVLTERFNKPFKRVPASGAHGTRLAESDVRQDAKEILTGDLICPKGFRFSVEVKSRADFNFWDLINADTKNEIDEWIEQAEGDAKIAGKDMLIIVKVNNRKPFVIYNPHFKEGYDPRWSSESNEQLVYKNMYYIQRIDYFLKSDDELFWER